MVSGVFLHISNCWRHCKFTGFMNITKGKLFGEVGSFGNFGVKDLRIGGFLGKNFLEQANCEVGTYLLKLNSNN
jgi:hypothetical protein